MSDFTQLAWVYTGLLGLERGMAVVKLPKRSLGTAPNVAIAALSAVMLVWSVVTVPAVAAPTGAAVRHGGQGHILLDAVPRASWASELYNWPEFHLGPSLDGYAANSPLTAATASRLGVVWATNLYGAAVDSPVAAYDVTLNEMIAYIGTEDGDLLAVNVADGKIVWSVSLGSPIRSTPIVSNGSVYATTINPPTIYRIDATTGVTQCSLPTSHEFEGSPVIATPPNTPTTLYIGSNDNVTSGPMIAMNAATCAMRWQFTGYTSKTGSWDAVAYSMGANNIPLILFGTSDPNSTIYAVNAITGTEVWHYAAANPAPASYDIGAGVTVSPPGSRGFPDGVVYAPTKYGIMYALNLTTGGLIWQYNFGQHDSLSTAALDGNNLVFGSTGGVYDLNAITGALIWHAADPKSSWIPSSVAIAGPQGSEIVAVADLAGDFYILPLHPSSAVNQAVYQYQTARYFTSSPAVVGGDILIAGADGFLYDFAIGGGNETSRPRTAIISPVNSSTIPNPNGHLTITGTANDTIGVSSVDVAVQADGPTGPWWDAATQTWSPGPVGSAATLASAGQSSTSWTFSYPVPPAGGTYQAIAYATSSGGQSDVSGATTSFAVQPTTKGPYIQASPSLVPPGETVNVRGGGFASGEAVTISLAGTVLATATAAADGALVATGVRIPATAPFGQSVLTATGQVSGREVTAPIIVANNWTQLGYGPARQGFEPNDSALSHLVNPGGNVFLYPAWEYQAGAAIAASPAIADQVAYIADTGGVLSAINVHNGAQLWTWTDPTNGAALNGAPSVDVSRGLVFVGDTRGTLFAIRASTGKLAWSKLVAPSGSTTEYRVSAPVSAASAVYVTATPASASTANPAVLRGFSATSGSEAWSVNLPSIVMPGSPSGALSAATLDTHRKLLFAGTSTGAVAFRVLSTQNTPLWYFATKGAITAPPMVSRGNVYFGSADGSVYANSEKNGAKVWSFAAGSPVADTPAIANSTSTRLIVGADNGVLYQLNTSNGAKISAFSSGEAIIGVAATSGVMVFDTALGTIAAVRNTGAHWLLHTQTGMIAPPAIANGAIFVTASNGTVYAFTGYGQPPEA